MLPSHFDICQDLKFPQRKHQFVGYGHIPFLNRYIKPWFSGIDLDSFQFNIVTCCLQLMI